MCMCTNPVVMLFLAIWHMAVLKCNYMYLYLSILLQPSTSQLHVYIYIYISSS